MNRSESMTLLFAVSFCMAGFLLNSASSQQVATSPLSNQIEWKLPTNAPLDGVPWQELGLISPAMSGPDKSKTVEQDKDFEKVDAIAKEIGLEGKWIVLSVEKDGDFSKAQIGQKPNDVISIVPGEDNGGPLALG